MTKPIYPCLWFDNKAKEAAEFYCSVFENSKIISETDLVVEFELNGKKFIGLNGGPMFKFTEAVSFVIECETQKEIDYYWDTLTKGGEESMCGWLKDKYGLSWQVFPSILPSLLNDAVKGPKIMESFRQIRKFDIAKLIEAAK
jgi:predicted 3-demethylubiquinone-9 3-methyltransferase (glyoxalase superfamily)